jgi:colicin import membrane protein
MTPLAPDYKRALYWALGLHISIVIMMLLEIDFPWQEKKPALTYAMQNVEVIQAQIVSQSVLDERDKRENEKKRAIEAEKQKQIDLARAAQLKREQEAAAKLALEQKKQAEAKQQALAKQQAEAKRLADAEKQKQLLLEQQKQAEAQAALQQEQAKQQQLLAEQQAIDAAQQAQLQQAILSEVERYTLMVKQKVMQNWLVQRGFEGLSTQLRVRVAPGGTVLDVQIVSQSGNEALDRSAVSAVYRSSPLPVPTDPAAFESFRELRLILRPEDVLG